jgi:hypothetical protein
LSLSAILAAAFFLSSNILAKSSALGGAGVGTASSASGTNVVVGDDLTPKPGMPDDSPALGGGPGFDRDGGKGGKDGGCCEGANGGIV